MILLSFLSLFVIFLVFFFKILVWFFPNFIWIKITPTLILVLLLGVYVFLGINIISRQESETPSNEVHDGIVQVEVALSYLRQGLNPYGVDYFGTALEDFNFDYIDTNPALYHFAYLPGILITSLPLQVASIAMTGFYDQRIMLGLVFGLFIIWLVWRYSSKVNLILLVPLLFLNFWFLFYFFYGLNDFLITALVILSLEFIIIRRYWVSAVILGLALATKQTAWFATPFLAQFVWYWLKNEKIKKEEAMHKFFIWLGTAVITVLIIILPFWLDNLSGFWGDGFGYQLGTADHSYPVAGIGISQIIYNLGLLADREAYFPFWFLQLVFGLPAGWLLWQWQKKRAGKPWVVLICWASWLGVIWYLNRYFTPTHLGALVVIICLAYFYKEIWQEGKFQKKSWFSFLPAGIIKK